jgi:hypothetical protein
MGNCISLQKDHVNVQTVCVLRNDTPYEEPSREERMENETRQRIRALNRCGN